MAPTKKPRACAHQTIYVDASEHGRKVAGFERISAEKRVAATTRSGKVNMNPPDTTGSETAAPAPDPSTFPGPLVLPDDDLYSNPKYPPQSRRSWASGRHRNPITPDRNTIYVAGVPTIDQDAGARFMERWGVPDMEEFVAPEDLEMEHPETGDAMAYLRAFYHPLAVKPLPTPLRFVKWEDDEDDNRGGRGGEKPRAVGLAAGTDRDGTALAVRVRTRPCPDEMARMQLNLLDLLDALSGVLPGDAYASVMLVEQDLYEDEDDDFCCGRAFGGSRISVVSSFRYRPVIDGGFGVDVAHAWPASHCRRFVEEFCHENGQREQEGEEEEEEEKEKSRGKHIGKRGREVAAGANARAGDHAEETESTLVDLAKNTDTAMGSALRASKKVLVPKTKDDERGLWFSRVARTAAHELGHCFGMDHCVYYACIMQGTGGLGEDARQPPYFCSVCESKFVFGLLELGVVDEGGAGRVGRWAEGREREVEMERMEAMKRFCEEWKGVGMFAGYAGWLDWRLRAWEQGERADEAGRRSR